MEILRLMVADSIPTLTQPQPSKTVSSGMIRQMKSIVMSTSRQLFHIQIFREDIQVQETSIQIHYSLILSQVIFICRLIQIA